VPIGDAIEMVVFDVDDTLLGHRRSVFQGVGLADTPSTTKAACAAGRQGVVLIRDGVGPEEEVPSISSLNDLPAPVLRRRRTSGTRPGPPRPVSRPG
jgi:hypothetical protein